MLLGSEKKSLKKQKGWRLDAELADYVEREGKRRGETNVIEDCIRLERALNAVLAPYQAQLEAFATANAMTMRDHGSAVIARAVVEALESYEKKKR